MLNQMKATLNLVFGVTSVTVMGTMKETSL